MTQDTPLFKTPSIEAFLSTSISQALDQALSALDAEQAMPEDPEGIRALVGQLIERFTMRDGPMIDEARQQFRNERNQLLTLVVPITGHAEYLTYQVRSLPPPTFVGHVSLDQAGGQLALTYKLKEGSAWENALDGDLAMLRTYMGSVTAAIAALNGTLPAMVEGKIRDTLAHLQVRREIAAKMAKRGFRES